VYCQFGLKWSDDAKDFVANPDGCTEVIKYGETAFVIDNC
jgi:hypothetical protein